VTNTLKVVYIMGRGRSGSTFVENGLAHRSKWPLLGESRLWPTVYKDSHACSCGKAKTDCPFWTIAIDTLPDYEITKAAFHLLGRRKALASLLLPNSIVRKVYAREITALANFYGHLASTHGLDYLIDSSKNPAFGRLLAMADGIDVQFVHVVRHPLGVAYSWKRQLQSGSNHVLHKQHKSLAMASLEWAASNLLSEIAKWRILGMHHTIRYESLGDPTVLNELVPASYTPTSTVQHAMSGNPSAASRQQNFLLDEEWCSGLTGLEKAVCFAISGPILLFYRNKR
jgi:hypothetical protein